jgi:hypothetical protein
MAITQNISNAFISVNDIVNNFIISYTGPGKIIPDSKRTEVVFHARRCLQEFAYETLKSQFTYTEDPIVASTEYSLPSDWVSIIKVEVAGTELEETTTPTPSSGFYYVNYSTNKIVYGDGGDLVLTYLSNALTTSESAAIPKLAEQAMYSCMIYDILANRENTNPNTLQRLLIEKTDKLEKAKSRLVFSNFSS